MSKLNEKILPRHSLQVENRDKLCGFYQQFKTK